MTVEPNDFIYELKKPLKDVMVNNELKTITAIKVYAPCGLVWDKVFRLEQLLVTCIIKMGQLSQNAPETKATPEADEAKKEKDTIQGYLVAILACSSEASGENLIKTFHHLLSYSDPKQGYASTALVDDLGNETTAHVTASMLTQRNGISHKDVLAMLGRYLYFFASSSLDQSTD